MDSLINKLAETSVLGLVLAISIVANYLLFRVIQDLSEKRLKDAKEVVENIMEPIKQLDQNARLNTSLLQKIMDLLPNGGARNA